MIARSYQNVEGFDVQGWDIVQRPTLQVRIPKRKQSHLPSPISGTCLTTAETNEGFERA
jgi:hypothetical protein